MKTIIYTIGVIITSIILFSCDNNDINPSLEEFCSVAPDGWECELIRNNFSQENIPQNAENPIAIIKYKNTTREFIKFENVEVNPSLILDFYPINHKDEFIDFIKSQQIYSWCIPIYYGETKDYFIITSPCFINNGIFTKEADSLINDLYIALDNIIIKKDYGI